MNVTSIRNMHKTVLYDGPMTGDFTSETGDFKEMAVGFIQAIFTGNDTTNGIFRLLVSIDDRDDTFALLSGSEQSTDGDCPAVGWNLCCIGYRFIKVQFIANGNAAGSCTVLAVGKLG